MHSPEVSVKKDVLKIFAKFKRKHLCESLLFNKAASLKYMASLEI